MALLEIAAVASLASGAMGFLGSSKAKKAARRAAAEEARIERAVTGRRVEQLNQEERTLAGDTRGRAVGSGVVANQGSVLSVLAEQAYEFEKERRITRRVGASRANAALGQGRAIGRQAQAQGLQNLFSGISQAASFWAARPKN